ncbi:MAG: MFS transporter [Hyphomicrobium sp.]|nr:MFS transporter [Hyphomicrobium sp.]
MTPSQSGQPERRRTLMERVVSVRPAELSALLASFTMFFALLSAYYIVRPVRDEMGVTVGKDAIHYLFSIVFVVMLAVVPVFGWIASRFPRRIVLPAVYLIFVLNLVGFWVLLKSNGAGPLTAASFFVWVSVFNLIVVSLFWSLMSELWSHEEAKRLYGFIAAGGTAGSLAGPALTQTLVASLAPADLLLVSAALLTLAMIAALVVRSVHPGAAGDDRAPAGGGIFDGAAKVFASPLLGRIALYVFLTNLVVTFFYMEQSRLVGATISDSAERVAFFANRDLIVGVATLLIQVFGTARVIDRFGVTGALVALPLTATAGVLALSYDPVLAVVAAVMVAERVIGFALTNPAVKIMYTLTAPDEKYKVQNFIDTVVYRGGDAASGWVFAAISGGAGFASLLVAVVAMPLVALWLWTARDLGHTHRDHPKDSAE